MHLAIKDRLVGQHYDTYIIAEIGSNWRSLEDCLESIHSAKLAGADAVKFQLYTHDSLYGFPGFIRGSLDPRFLPKLKEQCDKDNVAFIMSSFSVEELKECDKYVHAHKIASSEMCHVPLLEAAKESGKPVIISTGAQTQSEIDVVSREIMKDYPHALMYCVAEYPAKYVALDTIRLMKERYNTVVGFSDHTLDCSIIPLVAQKLCAEIIEKHFKIREMETPDSNHSLLPHEFELMVKVLRGKPIAAPQEKDMVARHKRRIKATKQINPGDTLSYGENYGFYRSKEIDCFAESPLAAQHIEGKKASRLIKAFEGISLGCTQDI